MSAPFIDAVVVSFTISDLTIFAYIPSLYLFQAKQRASVQWLLSKSYSHQVPEDVKEPFYRDVEVKNKTNLLLLSMDFW